MQSNLIRHLKQNVNLTEKEEQLIISKIKVQSVRKKEMFLKEGSTCKQLSYLNSGCARVYTIDDYALENNIYFALEDWWAIDLKSFIEQSPARFYIQALEACELHQIYASDFHELLEEIPQLEKWFRILLQNALISSENRINHKIQLNAEDRYQKFLEKYPSLEARISQKHIASYLGISPEFLSSLKAKLLKRKT